MPMQPSISKSNINKYLPHLNCETLPPSRIHRSINCTSAFSTENARHVAAPYAARYAWRRNETDKTGNSIGLDWGSYYSECCRNWRRGVQGQDHRKHLRDEIEGQERSLGRGSALRFSLRCSDSLLFHRS